METPKRPIETGRHACTVGLKSLFKIINDRSPEGREARRFFEQTRTSLQCKRVLTAKDFCWLCGGGFDRPEASLAPQCEHVLPVAQGVIFLELYSARRGDITEAMTLEYEWAHATCNNLKNDTVLITQDAKGFLPDVDKINVLLNQIRGKGIPVPKNQIESVQGRLFTVTDHVNKMPDFSINYSGVCPRPLVFAGPTTVAERLAAVSMETDGGRRKRTKRNKRRRHTRRR